MNTEHLNEIRHELSKAGTAEFFMITDNPGVQDMWQERQQLVGEMNQAISQAVGKIRNEYAERIRDIDLQYVMYLQLIMPRGDQS